MSISIYFSNTKDYNFLETLEIKKILGNKGFHLFRMKSLSLPVPDFFTISSVVCSKYIANMKFESGFEEELKLRISELGKMDQKRPFVVSVRSGSSVSMPGMMDTVLNVGLTSDIVNEIKLTNPNEYMFYLKNYRKLIYSYAKIVLEINLDYSHLNDEEEINYDIVKAKNHIRSLGSTFPENAYDQIFSSVKAVARSWMSDRAIVYRKFNNLSNDLGTSVTIQKMVFGDLNGATGVLFTRNPSNGKKELYGEYMLNSQGEDIVSGSKTPIKINDNNLLQNFPEAYKQLKEICKKLEHYYKEIQDIEFTIENGKLYILQTRSAKRTIRSSLVSTIDMLKEGLISEEEALLRIDPNSLDQLLHKSVNYNKDVEVIGKGLPASPGGACGRLAISLANAKIIKDNTNSNVILARTETSPEDISAINISDGIFTAFGGMTSHAAVVTRGMGKPCVCGVTNLFIDNENGSIKINGNVIKEGDYVTIDGNNGNIIKGKVELDESEIPEELELTMLLANRFKSLQVMANADTKQDVEIAVRNDACGIGLCRTEHMMLEPKKLELFRMFVLSRARNGNNSSIYVEKIESYLLEKLKNLYKNDFIELFESLGGKSIAIRLLDPPLHEFLDIKNDEEEISRLSSMYLNIGFEIFNISDTHMTLDDLFSDFKHMLSSMHEKNPMLGHRGCRLGITNPDLYEMQIRSIFESAIEYSEKLDKDDNRPLSKLAYADEMQIAHETQNRSALDIYEDSNTEVTQHFGSEVEFREESSVKIEITVPFITTEEEMIITSNMIKKIANEVLLDNKYQIKYSVGAMIELPRACLIADKIAKHCDYFSFGTNDLTQSTYGISRDDISSFLEQYKNSKIFNKDPFMILDTEGVGTLMKMAISLGKSTNPNLVVGICGEHGGDPESINFFNALGIDYISCSPYRIFKATLASARAKILSNNGAE